MGGSRLAKRMLLIQNRGIVPGSGRQGAMLRVLISERLEYGSKTESWGDSISVFGSGV